MVFRGEPGIGKSRLAAAEGSNSTVLGLVGSPFHNDAGLHPMRTLLERRCGIGRLTDQAERLRLLEAGIRGTGSYPASAPIPSTGANNGATYTGSLEQDRRRAENSDQWQAQPDMVSTEFAEGWLQGLSEPDEQLRTVWVEFDFVRKVFYADCDEATVAAAIGHLQPQAGYPWTVPCSLTEHPSVRCTSVVCSEDRVDPDWSRRTARDIGADLVELPGSHSPFRSRPSAVADVLLRVADGN